MIKQIYISYFYTVRFFTPNMVPLSTAVWDPKWYHDFKGQDYIFYDKRMVVNGLKAIPLVPDGHCRNLCRGPERCSFHGDASSCLFLKAYMEQLESINFDNLITVMDQVCTSAISNIPQCKDCEPIPVILVHEKPDNPCSERWPLLKWFKSNGVDLQELDFHALKDGLSK